MNTQKYNRLKKELIDFCQRSGEQGWCPGNLGNISVFNPEEGRVCIKRSGADLSRLQLKDVLTLNIEGNVLEGKGEPSMETGLHLGIYRIRKDIRSVFHVHPPYATAYAVKGIKIPMVTEAARIVLVEVPLLPQATAGSVELAEKVAEAFNDASVKAVLLREHGIVVGGRNIEDAYNMTALVEDTAKIAFLSSLL